VLSGSGLCDELITRPEESYRLCCVVVCDLENLKNEEAMTLFGSQRHSKKKNHVKVGTGKHKTSEIQIHFSLLIYMFCKLSKDVHMYFNTTVSACACICVYIRVISILEP